MTERKRRRDSLRVATNAAHLALESRIGDIAVRANYQNYVAGMLAFRSAAEAHVAKWRRPVGWSDWRPTRVASDLAVDLIALGLDPRIMRYDDEVNDAAAIGVLYVLEGSCLGARVTLRKAEALGLKHGGARHLRRQAAAIENWVAFLDRLENEPQLDLDRASRSASRAFEHAERAMRGAA